MDKTSMIDNDIKVIFDSTHTFILSSNNPNLDGFITTILDIKDKCDFKLLKVETSNEEFDKDGFESILIKSIEEFIKELELNKENLKNALDKIKDEKSKNVKFDKNDN